jgi:hypothetical protein
VADNGKAAPKGAAFYISFRSLYKMAVLCASPPAVVSKKIVCGDLREGVYRRFASEQASSQSNAYRHTAVAKVATFETSET